MTDIFCDFRLLSSTVIFSCVTEKTKDNFGHKHFYVILLYLNTLKVQSMCILFKYFLSSINVQNISLWDCWQLSKGCLRRWWTSSGSVEDLPLRPRNTQYDNFHTLDGIAFLVHLPARQCTSTHRLGDSWVYGLRNAWFHAPMLLIELPRCPLPRFQRPPPYSLG